MLSISKRILYMFLGGIVALVVVGALAVGGTAVFAQDGEEATPAAPPAQEDGVPVPGVGGPRGGRHGDPRPDFGERGTFLAEALGISVEELEAAQEAVRTTQMAAMLDQAVADGLITQEEADAILSGESSPRDFGPELFGLERNGRFGDKDPKELLAAELGITVEELEAAETSAREAAIDQALADGTITQEQADMMAAGQALREYIDDGALLADVLGVSAEEVTTAKENGTLRDLIEASGLTSAELSEAMQAAHEEAVAQAVADGVITQEQADLLQSMPGRDGLGGPRGGHGVDGPCGDRGPRGGGFPGGPQNDNVPAAPDTVNPTGA